MSQTAILLLITFIESFSTILSERGSYFFCKEYLKFNTMGNLWLALTFGSGYLLAAWRAHWLVLRIGDKRQLMIALAVLVCVHIWLYFCVSSVVIFIAMGLLGMANGAKWPVLEGFLAGGLTPSQTAKVMGKFNITWAASVPLALAAAGFLMSIHANMLFVAGGAVSLAALALAQFLPKHPAASLPAPASIARHEHPEHLAGLLVASRWVMMATYISVFVFAPLAPSIFEKLGCSRQLAPATSGVLDVMRFAAFVSLGLWQGWRGRARWLGLTMLILPAGFFMVILGPNITTVMIGEILFGFAAGMSYSSAMYCAMVVKEASVDAAGGHESMIGLGLIIGPLAGLAGDSISTATGSFAQGYITAMAPVLGICIAAAIWSIYKRPPITSSMKSCMF
ncbi:MAG: MFS transporter [bacterium]|nr:MFS transporter [bacterium]